VVLGGVAAQPAGKENERYFNLLSSDRLEAPGPGA
jgi:hypothetical protein